jgi:hypothetical protein
VSFWKKHPQHAHGERPPFVDETDRKNMVAQGYEFTVTRVVANPTAVYDGKPTPRWELFITIDAFVGDPHNGQRTLTLSMNPQRDEMFRDMATYLADTETAEPIRCTLGWFKPEKTNGFYTLDPVFDTEEN